MDVIKVDPLEPQSLQTAFASFAQMLRATIFDPLAWTGAPEARLGGDHEVPRVGKQRLSDQSLGHFRTIGVGGVDQGDSKLDRTTEDGEGFFPVWRLSPDAGTSQSHGAEAEPVNGQVAAQIEGPAADSRAGSGGTWRRGGRHDRALPSVWNPLEYVSAV